MSSVVGGFKIDEVVNQKDGTHLKIYNKLLS